MWFHKKTDFERFVEAFIKRYEDELKVSGKSIDDKIQLYWLYLEFRDSGLSPEQWLEQQELA
jgi:hypothetical protein